VRKTVADRKHFEHWKPFSEGEHVITEPMSQSPAEEQCKKEKIAN
jgi:hypothetical protein